MGLALCDLTDLQVNQCACRLHAGPELRGHAADGGGRDGYPAAGVAALLGAAHNLVITDPEFGRALTRIREAASDQQAVRELAQFCADSAHWWESYRPQRARWVAILTLATADRLRARPVDVLALIEDAGEVPWERPARASWIAAVDAIFQRRSGASGPR